MPPWRAAIRGSKEALRSVLCALSHYAAVAGSTMSRVCVGGANVADAFNVVTACAYMHCNQDEVHSPTKLHRVSPTSSRVIASSFLPVMLRAG